MRISAPSFFQVNTAAAELLIELVVDALKPGPDDVALDPYWRGNVHAAARTPMQLGRSG